MRSQAETIRLSKLENPEEVRVTRDRAIALAFVRRGEGANAASEILEEMGLPRTEANRRRIYRAIERQRDWARDIVALQKEKADSPDKDCPPAISTEPEAEAPVTDSVTQDAASTPHRRSRTA